MRTKGIDVKSRRIAEFLVALIALSAVAGSIQAAELSFDELKATYARHLKQHTDEKDQSVKLVKADYLGKLTALEKQFTASGELEGVLAVRTAVEEISDIKHLVPVNKPIALKQVQDEVVKKMAALKKSYFEKINTLGKSYIAQLAVVEKKLVKAGQIDEAVEVNRALKEAQARHAPEPEPTPDPPAIASTKTPGIVSSPAPTGKGLIKRPPNEGSAKVWKKGEHPTYEDQSGMSLYPTMGKSAAIFGIKAMVMEARLTGKTSQYSSYTYTYHFPRIMISSRSGRTLKNLRLGIRYLRSNGNPTVAFTEEVSIPELGSTPLIIDPRGYSSYGYSSYRYTRHGGTWGGLHIRVIDSAGRMLCDFATYQGFTEVPGRTPTTGRNTSRRGSGFRKF